MKFKLFFLFSLVFLFTNCNQEVIEEPEDPIEIPIATEFPDCIDSLFFEEDDHSVKAQYFEDEFHYWLDTPASSWDGTEYIIDDNCDTVCSFNGLFHGPCWKAYDAEGWVQLWPE